MELHNANRSWRLAASSDRPTPARTLLVSQSNPICPLSPAFLLRLSAFLPGHERIGARITPPRGCKCSSTIGDGGLGPALNHENYETNPKQYLRILFRCNRFALFWCFFCRRNEPKSSGPPGPGRPDFRRRPPGRLFRPLGARPPFPDSPAANRPPRNFHSAPSSSKMSFAALTLWW
jgi:hypothetical protein